MEYDTITLYKSWMSRQWRWRYQALGNGAKLANGGESYAHVHDALVSAFRVCDLGNPYAEIGEALADTLVKSLGGREVMVRFKE